MQNTVQNGGGDGDVGKDLIPLGEGLVGGKDRGRFFIPPGNELEKQVCALDVHREIADLVNDEHPVLGQNFELVRQPVLKVGLLELFNELVAVDVVGGETGAVQPPGPRAEARWVLPTPGGPEEDHIFPVFQETHGGQFIDLALVNGGLEREIEVVQGLLNGEAGHLNLLLIGPSPLGFGFF